MQSTVKSIIMDSEGRTGFKKWSKYARVQELKSEI
jgi:hypothetical protein